MSTLEGHTQGSVRIGTLGEGAVTPQETEPDLPAGVGGSPAEAGGGCGSPRDKDTGSRSSGKNSLV